MKLKNKKTGEIAEPFGITCVNGRTFVQFDDEKGTFKFEAHSLAELNEEWEDYEEPKEYWYIEPNGVIARIDEWDCCTASDIEIMKLLGNYFSSREEAEKVVEKLKAWKRLKDKGFRFTGINDDEDAQELITQCGILCEADIYHLAKDEDFLLLFGGEDGE